MKRGAAFAHQDQRCWQKSNGVDTAEERRWFCCSDKTQLSGAKNTPKHLIAPCCRTYGGHIQWTKKNTNTNIYITYTYTINHQTMKHSIWTELVSSEEVRWMCSTGLLCDCNPIWFKQICFPQSNLDNKKSYSEKYQLLDLLLNQNGSKTWSVVIRRFYVNCFKYCWLKNEMKSMRRVWFQECLLKTQQQV